MHDPIQQVDSTNAPKRNSVKHDRPKFMQVSECNTTSARLIVCLKTIPTLVFLDSFFSQFYA